MKIKYRDCTCACASHDYRRDDDCPDCNAACDTTLCDAYVTCCWCGSDNMRYRHEFEGCVCLDCDTREVTPLDARERWYVGGGRLTRRSLRHTPRSEREEVRARLVKLAARRVERVFCDLVRIRQMRERAEVSL